MCAVHIGFSVCIGAFQVLDCLLRWKVQVAMHDLGPRFVAIMRMHMQDAEGILALLIRSKRLQDMQLRATCLPCSGDPLARSCRSKEAQLSGQLTSDAGHHNPFGRCEVGTSVTAAPVGSCPIFHSLSLSRLVSVW